MQPNSFEVGSDMNPLSQHAHVHKRRAAWFWSTHKLTIVRQPMCVWVFVWYDCLLPPRVRKGLRRSLYGLSTLANDPPDTVHLATALIKTQKRRWGFVERVSMADRLRDARAELRVYVLVGWRILQGGAIGKGEWMVCTSHRTRLVRTGLAVTWVIVFDCWG